jgi:D-methionine transport system ATP-binding protein
MGATAQLEAEAPVVVLSGVSKRYAQSTGTLDALSSVDLTVRRGTIQGVIGSSGAGKTTLLRAISSLEKPDSGRVLIDGADLAGLGGPELRSARRRIGVVFQQFHLLRSRTVAGNIAFPLEVAGAGREEIGERVAELLRWFGLESKASAYPAQLSGGQQQRVAIARALANRPAVLLSDEPTSALDAETTASVLDLLRRVRDELGVTIILITHELAAVRAICDRVAVIDHGRIVEEGPVDRVMLRPESAAARRLLGMDTGIAHIEEYAGSGNCRESLFVELQFFGPGATDPILSELSRALDVSVNILRAEIGKLNGAAYGLMLVEIRGPKEARGRSLLFLAGRGVAVNPLPLPGNLEAAS